MLEHCHVLLLFEELLGHFGEDALLILLDLLHPFVDLILPIIQLFVLFLQVDETAAKTLDTHTLIIIASVFVACARDDLLQEVSVLA